MEPNVIFAILGMSLFTYIPRLTPMIVLAGRDLPGPLKEWLSFLPPAILGALVAQAVLFTDGRVNVSLANPALVPAIVTGIIAWRSRSLAWTIVGGLVVAAGYRSLGL